MSRKDILREFALLKRDIRKLKRAREMVTEKLRCLDRERRQLERRRNPFDAQRIEILLVHSEACVGSIRDINKLIADYGPLLVSLCHAADQLVSDHDKAQILGISHIRLQKDIEKLHRIDGAGDGRELFLLISAGHAEHHFENSSSAEQRPLWEVAHLATLQALEEDHGFRESMNDGAMQWLQEMGVPSCRITIGPDGQEHLERIPPTLRVVH